MKRVILFLVLAVILPSGIIAQDSVKTEQINIRALLEKQIKLARQNTKKSAETDSVSVSEAENVDNNLQINIDSANVTNKPQQQKSGKVAELMEIASFIEKTKKNIWTKLTNLPPFKRVLLPYFLLVEIILLGTILALWISGKRINNRNNGKRKSVSGIKYNVEKLRNEKLIITKNDNEASKLRTSLINLSLRLDDGGREIISFAKSKGISKGEVILAVKLKRLLTKYKI